MTVSCLIIGVIAMEKVDHEALVSYGTGRLDQFIFRLGIGTRLDQHSSFCERKDCRGWIFTFLRFLHDDVIQRHIRQYGWTGTKLRYAKSLATKSPSEAAKMSGFVSLVLLLPRYFMITGFTVLAIVFMSDDFAGNNVDFERILPLAINEFVPHGLMGLFLAGLLAAFISTFASTVNAAPAYLINDIYLKYINPNAERKQLINYSYLISLGVVVLSTLIGLYVMSINTVIQWIVSALYGGYIAANVLKWHWWRFNGHGYFWGMAAGIVASMIFPFVFPNGATALLFSAYFSSLDYRMSRRDLCRAACR